MIREVVFSPKAEADLFALGDWIADQAGTQVALSYVGRLREYCGRFSLFPERGARRDDLAPGARLVGFEGRVAIIFTVGEQSVVILRILYGGQNIIDRISDL